MRTRSLSIALGLVALSALVAPARADTDAVLAKAGCVACHTKDKKLVGPPFQDIAAKYKGKAGVEATLFEKVRKGGSGSFGPVPMSPNPPDKISDAELKSVVGWILKL